MRGRLSAKNINFKKAVFVLVFLAILAVFNFSGFSERVQNFFFLISSPAQITFRQAGRNISGFFGGTLEAENIKKEMELLELKNRELFSQIVSLVSLRKENEFLREALGIGLEKEFKLVLARAISRDVFADSILVNKGEKDGVLEGQPVISGQKVLLGKIGRVYKNFAEVILISNKKSSFDAQIFEKNIYGIARGKGGLGLYLDLIPKEEEVLESEIVVTSVLGGVYPSGLLVGQIQEVKRSDLEPFQAAEIEPFFDIKQLDYLFIIEDF